MIEEQIEALVRDHYSSEDAGVLLLSTLGKKLTDSRHWPLQNDSRTLTEIVDETDSLSLVRDEEAKAFIAIVLAGDESIAHAAIANRHRRAFLKEVSRALLAAFTIHVDSGKQIYVHLQPKLRFSIRDEPMQDGIPVDADLRVPEVDASDVRNLDLEEVAKLDSNIREWCQRHGVEHSSITWKQERNVSSSTVDSAHSSNALERLYAAQEQSITKRLVIPFDIAIELSRMK